MIVSTHHRAISGDALTHQRAVESLVAAGAHVLAEHSVSESFSGDGLIAVSFDDRDRDWTVPISFARAKDTLFGEVELEVDLALKEVGKARSEVASLSSEVLALGNDAANLRTDLLAMRDELERMKNSRLWRALAPVRALQCNIRRRLHPQD